MSEIQLDDQTRELLRQRCRDDLYFLAKGVLGFDWLVPQIHGPLCRKLQNPQTTRFTGVLPRGWLKSTVATIAYPIQRSLRDPNVRCCIVQNSFSNACRKLSVIRSKWETCGLLRALFPELLPGKNESWTNESLCLKRPVQNAESTYEAAGTRTKSTSRHYDLIVEDDTVAPDLDDLTAMNMLPSREDVEQAIGWHRLALPLLVDPIKSTLLIIGTRWFEKDLISWNMENEPHYEQYFRAARETAGLPDEDGTAVYPERFPEKVLNEIKNTLGPYLYSCLYMNSPVSSAEMIFQPEWFRYYETVPQDVVCYTTVDLAGDPASTKGDPDWNVVMTTAKDLVSGRIYVLDYFHARCNSSEVVQEIFNHVRRFKPVTVGIEAVGYQLELIHWVKERMRMDNLYFTVQPISHGKRSKPNRIRGLQPLINSGMMMFRNHHGLLITELCAFPYSKYDDLSDALSMQIPMWAITHSLKERTAPRPEDDPMSFEYAFADLHSRNKKSGLSDRHAFRNVPSLNGAI